MLGIVSVKAFNRATGMQIDGQYAVCAQSREEAVAWVVTMFEQTDVQFVVDEVSTGSAVSLMVRGENSLYQTSFTTAARNVSIRARTSA